MKKVFDIFVWLITGIYMMFVFLMPKIIPIHWNTHWEIDGYGSRYILFIFVLMPIFVYYGMLLTKKIDPKKKSFQNKGKTYDLFRYGMTVFFMMIVGLIEYMIFFPKTNLGMCLIVLLGVFMIAMGNYMPRLPQNYFLGIKTPWTLASEYVWQKSHKFGGYSFVLSGLIIVLCGLLQIPYAFIVMMVVVIGSGMSTCGYSYYIYKKESEDIDL